MSYKYTIQLELANEKERGKFDLMTIEHHIKSAMDDYDKMETVRNKKTLFYRLSPKILEIDIHSPVELVVPSKSIAKFTRILLKYSKELSAIVYHGRVFQSVQTKFVPNDIDKISNTKTLQKLVEIFYPEGELNTSQNNELLILQREIKKLVFKIED